MASGTQVAQSHQPRRAKVLTLLFLKQRFPKRSAELRWGKSRRRTNVQQQTCKMVWSFSFYSLLLSKHGVFEVKPLILRKKRGLHPASLQILEDFARDSLGGLLWSIFLSLPALQKTLWIFLPICLGIFGILKNEFPMVSVSQEMKREMSQKRGKLELLGEQDSG